MTTQSSNGHIPFVDLATQHSNLESEINQAIQGVLHRSDFILGENVAKFENEFADYCEAPFAIGVDSGTSALELILLAYGIGPGDEVITVANTFIATVLAISYAGATPVLVDIDRETFLMDPNALEAAITSRTKAIVPVHLFGHPVDMDPVMELADRHGLLVIEDAAQAHGARYKGRRVGSIGDAAAFSFYPGKNLGALGDAGMAVTGDRAIAEKLRMLRNYGSSKKYHHEIRGFNRRLDTLQAAVLRVKLKHLDRWNAARRRHAQEYDRLLDGHTWGGPKVTAEMQPVHHLYVIRADDREGLQAHLGEQGVATVIHYPLPIHLQPAYQDLGYTTGDFPITEAYASQILSLPMFPELQPHMVSRVAGAVRSYVNTRRREPTPL